MPPFIAWPQSLDLNSITRHRIMWTSGFLANYTRSVYFYLSQISWSENLLCVLSPPGGPTSWPPSNPEPSARRQRFVLLFAPSTHIISKGKNLCYIEPKVRLRPLGRQIAAPSSGPAKRRRWWGRSRPVAGSVQKKEETVSEGQNQHECQNLR